MNNSPHDYDIDAKEAVDARLKPILGDAFEYTYCDDFAGEPPYESIRVELNTNPRPTYGRGLTLTFEMLQRLSEEFGTKSIDIDTTPEQNRGEGSGSSSEVQIVIRGATK